jgi:hypothetical protein
MESVARSPPVPSGETHRSSSAGTTVGGPFFTRDRHDRHDRAGMPAGRGLWVQTGSLHTVAARIPQSATLRLQVLCPCRCRLVVCTPSQRGFRRVPLCGSKFCAHVGADWQSAHRRSTDSAECHSAATRRAANTRGTTVGDRRYRGRLHAAAAGRAACLSPGVVRLDAASSRHAVAAPRRPRSPGGATTRHASRTSGCGSACPRLLGP